MPEKSNTLELSVNYMTNIYAVQANGYWIRNKNTLVTFKGSAGNLGDRVVVGSDFMAQALIPNSGLRRLNAWAYFSWIIQAEEKVPSPEDKAILLREDIGDLAKYKLWLGATAEFNRYFSATVLARKIWQRETVESNPIDSIPGFQIIDLNFLLEDFYVDGLGLALKVENLLDEKYFHPGVMQADSGEIPGKFDADGAWLGSKGIFNSKLPQPGRTISLTLFIDY